MALSAGTKLGPYEIQTLIGAGGHGRPYRARDTRLDRMVALKLLLADKDPALNPNSSRSMTSVGAQGTADWVRL
jgi:serine/threonine protein kinase